MYKEMLNVISGSESTLTYIFCFTHGFKIILSYFQDILKLRIQDLMEYGEYNESQQLRYTPKLDQ
ncbi:MAG: hypothetical protein RBG13Loki_1415 [Promethearchaeota archaeon CR_4]|nr:MAG: hypothetical protein RBG13Loki_1415 [Candidatus Lokiarchaeota archaeon CR_4]